MGNSRRREKQKYFDVIYSFSSLFGFEMSSVKWETTDLDLRGNLWVASKV